METIIKLKPRLLFVDDEQNFRSLISASLRSAGFEVTEVDDGNKAVRLIKEQTFDIALIDLKLPNLDGNALFKILRNESPSTDCVIITAYKEIESAIEAIKVGAKDFLLKPQNTEDIVNRIKMVMKVRSAESTIKNLQAKFTSKLLHDLLAPLYTVKSAMDFLEQETAGPVTEQQKNIFQSIQKTINRMNVLLNDMVDLNLFQYGCVDLEKIPINLDELVPAICARFIPIASSKNIELTFNVKDDIPTIEIDPDKIEQAINNLLDNAIKYTTNGGFINVGLSTAVQQTNGKNVEFIELSVSDSGVGIPEAELPFIFDKYKNFLSGKTGEKKTIGLGLAICRSIIEAHRGKMIAESEFGKGSSFKLFLPIDSMN